MLFNADSPKCKTIHIVHSNCHADYYMCGNKFETVDEECVTSITLIRCVSLRWIMDENCVSYGVS